MLDIEFRIDKIIGVFYTRILTRYSLLFLRKNSKFRVENPQFKSCTGAFLQMWEIKVGINKNHEQFAYCLEEREHEVHWAHVMSSLA